MADNFTLIAQALKNPKAYLQPGVLNCKSIFYSAETNEVICEDTKQVDLKSFPESTAVASYKNDTLVKAGIVTKDGVINDAEATLLDNIINFFKFA